MAARAACWSQLTLMCLTANFASATEKPLPADESSCWIRPSLENPGSAWRYCSAAVMADCWDVVYCGAAGADEGADEVAATGAAGAPEDEEAGGVEPPWLLNAAMTMIATMTAAIPRGSS